MKSLVIYFSHIGENYTESGIKKLEIGNTEIVANYIKELTNADLFKVEAKEKYPENYDKCCSYAKKELNNHARPELKNYLLDISSYDVIFIGGPVWWNHYPMPIFSCLEKLNFKDKIIMPFTTHEGSRLGNTLSDVFRMCPGSKIKRGLALNGSHVKESKKEIEEWIKGEL